MTLFLLVLVGAALGNLGLSVWAVWRARGVWRLGAALPLVALMAVAFNIAAAVSRDPTAHNLWPLEIALTCAGGIVFSLIFITVQILLRPKKTSHWACAGNALRQPPRSS